MKVASALKGLKRAAGFSSLFSGSVDGDNLCDFSHPFCSSFAEEEPRSDTDILRLLDEAEDDHCLLIGLDVVLKNNNNNNNISLSDKEWSCFKCRKINNKSLKVFNPFTLRVSLESVVCYSHTFENIFWIKQKFTKYLKESSCLACDQHFSFKCIQENVFLNEIFPKLSGLFWLLWVLMG